MTLNIVTKADDRVVVRNVLISVSDKSGLEDFVPGLVAAQPQVKLLSTGGTFAAISSILGAEAASRHLIQVSDYTGQPEMQGGLVKTLDFKIYLGLLSEAHNVDHRNDLSRTGAITIDMVVVNLYPFQQTIARPDLTPELARTNIDIGGPCMVRAAAKNYLRVASVTDPRDYPQILAEMSANKASLSLDTRFELMRKAFAHTAAYDSAIATHFAGLDVAAIGRQYEIGS